MICGGFFDLDNKKKKLDNLSNKLNNSSFWDDKEQADNVLKEISSIKNVVLPIKDVKNKVLDNLSLIDDDEDMLNLLSDELSDLKKKVDDLKIYTYLSGDYDKNNCFLEIHSGAGGTEACDWVAMLLRMYERYCEKKGYTFERISYTVGEEVGFKSVMIKISGEYTYGYLKGERGVHRLVRISPFDSNKRRHTSFASVEVTPELDNDVEFDIKEPDLKIDVYRSSGAGGQSVNTTDSAVRVTHIPTGIIVTCQNERSQIQNRRKALEILMSKLYLLEIDKKKNQISELKKGQMSIGFGSGKRSYVMCPYTKVHDNDTGYETSDVESILDGDIEEMIIAGVRRL